MKNGCKMFLPKQKKLIENYDVGKRYNYVPHKKYINQVMFIVVNGFLPKDNNILGNGGRCIKVSFVPVWY